MTAPLLKYASIFCKKTRCFPSKMNTRMLSSSEILLEKNTFEEIVESGEKPVEKNTVSKTDTPDLISSRMQNIFQPVRIINLIDGIVRPNEENSQKSFSHVAELFLEAYAKGDDNTRRELIRIRNQWIDCIPLEVIVKMDELVQKIDPEYSAYLVKFNNCDQKDDESIDYWKKKCETYREQVVGWKNKCETYQEQVVGSQVFELMGPRAAGKLADTIVERRRNFHNLLPTPVRPGGVH